MENPFIKSGIYTQVPIKECQCETCAVNTEPDMFFGEDDICEKCRTSVEQKKTNPDYEIDHLALAEFISNRIGCTSCRQFKKTGWQFGTLRDYDVCFACSPTPGMYKALESTPKSVLIIGKNTPKLLPASLATRVIYLSRLLLVENGEL